MNRPTRWLLAVGFLIVSWAGAFGIAIGVVEWRMDGDDSASVSTDVHVEWALCVNDVQWDIPGEFITESSIAKVIEVCDPAITRTWIYCINEGWGRGNPDVPVTVQEAQDIARSCERELED